MSRELSASITAATTAPVVQPIVLVRADFASGFLRLHSGYGTTTYSVDGTPESFLGVGHLGKMSNAEEGTDLATPGMTFSLSGIPSEHIALVLGEQYQGRSIRAWLGLFDPATGGVLPDAFEFFTGRMDTSTIEEGPDTSTVTITAENEMSDLRRTRERRFTHEDMRLLHPTERGFEYVLSMVDRTINWGRAYRKGETRTELQRAQDMLPILSRMGR